jgi:hypothetical protein
MIFPKPAGFVYPPENPLHNPIFRHCRKAMRFVTLYNLNFRAGISFTASAK